MSNESTRASSAKRAQYPLEMTMTKSCERLMRRYEEPIRRCERLQQGLGKLGIPADAPIFENPEVIRKYAEAHAASSKAGKRSRRKN